jgi:hypothetical protein
MSMPNKHWIITASEDRPLRDIVKDLEGAGLTVGEINDEIQSVTGSAAEEAAEKMRAVKGVVDVTPDEPIDIGPPGSDTW